MNAVACGLLALLLSAVCGCSSTSSCNRDAELVKYQGGAVTGNSYASSPWNDGYVYYPPARTIRFYHQLNTEPSNIEIALAFDSSGFGLAPAAGNQAIIKHVDAEYIDVKNDTCSDFYIRLIAERPTYDGAAGAPGMDASAAVAGEAGATL